MPPGRSYTLASIMDESDDSLDDLELDADVAEVCWDTYSARVVIRFRAVCFFTFSVFFKLVSSADRGLKYRLT